LFVWLLLAAYRAATTYFSCLHKKSKQKKCTPLPVPLWALLRKTQAGSLCARSQGGAAELATRLQRCAQTTATSQRTMQMRPTAHLLTLRSARLGTGRRDGDTYHDALKF